MRKTLSYLATLLLVSGRVSLCPRVHREYHLVTSSKTWEDARLYCREKYSDLAVVANREDMERLVKVAVAHGLRREVWIGLRKDGEPLWLWSVGETRSSPGAVDEYTNWASLPEPTHHCGSMRSDGKWLSALCESTLPFVCRGYDGSGGMRVVLEPKTWRQAQDHCRLNDGDLASARSHTENQEVRNIINENAPERTSPWIGLSRDEYKWSDRSESSFRYWHTTQPNDDGICVMYNSNKKKWYDRGCSALNYFFCHEATAKRKLEIVRVEMASNAFFNVNDSAVSEATLNQIQQNHGGVKLRWRVQPDGKVFHRKEKEEPCQ